MHRIAVSLWVVSLLLVVVFAILKRQKAGKPDEGKIHKGLVISSIMLGVISLVVLVLLGRKTVEPQESSFNWLGTDE